MIDLGRTTYIEADKVQRQEHAAVVNGAAPALIVFECDPVITISRRKGADQHILHSRKRLAEMGIDVQQTDRGGDVTYHGPGQIVAYPILRLADYGFNVSRYIRFLEQVVIDTLATYDIWAHRDPKHTGVWAGDPPVKICAIGVRVSRGVSLHGLALNVTTDLSHFDAIVPCGIADRGVTSVQAIRGENAPAQPDITQNLCDTFSRYVTGGV